MKPKTGNECIDAILHAAHRIRTTVDRELRSVGLSLSAYKVLRALEGNSRSMREISDVLRVSPRTVTDIVDGLQSRELVLRCEHPSDGRVTLLRLTPQGEAALGRARQDAERSHAYSLGRLSAAEQQSLRELLERVCVEAD